jgi:hypothetical protein
MPDKSQEFIPAPARVKPVRLFHFHFDSKPPAPIFDPMNALKPFLAIAAAALVVVVAISLWHLRVNSAVSAISEVPMTSPGDNESYAAKLARYRASAEDTARAECTNEITGLRNIITLDVETSDDNFRNWTATATVEFINQIGGVDRTNLVLQFNPAGWTQTGWSHKAS